jgi:hypothetical protein
MAEVFDVVGDEDIVSASPLLHIAENLDKHSVVHAVPLPMKGRFVLYRAFGCRKLDVRRGSNLGGGVE